MKNWVQLNNFSQIIIHLISRNASAIQKKMEKEKEKYFVVISIAIFPLDILQLTTQKWT